MKKNIEPIDDSKPRRKPYQTQEGEIKFYYNREERLKKLKRNYSSTTPRFFRTRRSRILLILFIDIILIIIVAYFINKPANLYITKKVDNLQFELNVSGIRGKKVLVGFSVKNLSKNTYQFTDSEKVILKILKEDGSIITREKMFPKGMELQSGESTSLIFLFSQNQLPARGKLSIFYSNYDFPVFSKNIKF